MIVRLSLIAGLLLGTAACGGNINNPVAETETDAGNPAPIAEIDPSNPTQVKEAFEKQIAQDLETISPKLEEQIEEKDAGGGPSNFYSAEAVGTYSFDIQETDSIVTPYVGQVDFAIIWHSDIAPDPEYGLEGGKNENDMLLRAEYAFQDEQWVLTNAYRIAISDTPGVGGPITDESSVANPSWAVALFQE